MGEVRMHLRVERMVGGLTLTLALISLLFPSAPVVPLVSTTFMVALVIGVFQIVVANKPDWIGKTPHFISALLGAGLWTYMSMSALNSAAPVMVVILYFAVMVVTLWDLSNA